MAFPFFRWEALERWKDDSNFTEAQWDSLRIVGIIAGLGLAGAAAYWGGRPAWNHWQSRQALAQSRAFAAQRDYPSMFLALRRATTLAPRDRFVWEETARALGQVGSSDELLAREELTRLSPGDSSAQLAYADDALRFGRYEVARAALDAAAAAGRTDAAYQRLAVALAVAQEDAPRLRLELKKLIELEPDNHNARFTYAALRLWGADPGEAAAARTELEALLAVRDVRVRAMIELISEAARRGGPLRVHQLILRGLAVFSPAAQAVPPRSETQAWEQLLQGLKAGAPPGASDSALLARWLADLGRRGEALAWLQSLGPELQGAAPVKDLTAQLAAEEKNDAVLRQALTGGAWGAWPAAAWNLAIEHRRQSGGPGAGGISWAAALAACGDSLEGLRNLGRLASAWQQPRDAEAAWLAVLDRAPAVRWALQALEMSERKRGDSAALLNLYARWSEQYPLDDSVAERWITVAAELDRVTPGVAARARVLASAKGAAGLAQAAILWRQHRPEAAERLLFGLPENLRNSADGSLWIALTEAELGHQAAAAAALSAARKFPRDAAETALLEAAARRARELPGA